MSDFLTVVAERIQAQVPSEVRPDDPHQLRLFRFYALLALAKGTETTREDVHNAWVAWMVEIDVTHTALVPFGELSEDQHRQDDPFLAAIKAVVAEGLAG